MQLTRQTEYALCTLLELSKHPPGTILQAKIISLKQNIPEVFLKKTIQLLNSAGLVNTIRGSKGGVSLRVESSRITIAQVYTAIEGKLAINPCLADSAYCKNTANCVVHSILNRAQNALVKELSRETLADMVVQQKQKDKASPLLEK